MPTSGTLSRQDLPSRPEYRASHRLPQGWVPRPRIDDGNRGHQCGVVDQNRGCGSPDCGKPVWAVDHRLSQCLYRISSLPIEPGRQIAHSPSPRLTLALVHVLCRRRMPRPPPLESVSDPNRQSVARDDGETRCPGIAVELRTSGMTCIRLIFGEPIERAWTWNRSSILYTDESESQVSRCLMRLC